MIPLTALGIRIRSNFSGANVSGTGLQIYFWQNHAGTRARGIQRDRAGAAKLFPGLAQHTPGAGSIHQRVGLSVTRNFFSNGFPARPLRSTNQLDKNSPVLPRADSGSGASGQRPAISKSLFIQVKTAISFKTAKHHKLNH